MTEGVPEIEFYCQHGGIDAFRIIVGSFSSNVEVVGGVCIGVRMQRHN